MNSNKSTTYEEKGQDSDELKNHTPMMQHHGTVQIGHGDEKRGGRNDACEAKDPARGRYSMITAQWLQRSQRAAPWCVGVRLQAALRIATLNPVIATGHPLLR